MEDFFRLMKMCVDWMDTDILIWGYHISFWRLGWYMSFCSIVIYVIYGFFDD